MNELKMHLFLCWQRIRKSKILNAGRNPEADRKVILQF